MSEGFISESVATVQPAGMPPERGEWHCAVAFGESERVDRRELPGGG